MRTRVMLTAVAILVVVFVVLVVIISRNVSSNIERLVTSEMDETLRSVGTQLKASRFQDASSIKKILSSYDIAMEGGVLVLDSTGKVIADSRDIFAGQEMADASWYAEVRSAQTVLFEFELGATDVYAKSMEYGDKSIITYLPLSTVNSYKYTPVVIVISVGGIGLIVLISLLHLALTRIVTQPLESISGELEELERGERIDEDVVGRNVDGKQLVSSINTMLDRLDISLPASAALKVSRPEVVGTELEQPEQTDQRKPAEEAALLSDDHPQPDAAPELLLFPVSFTLEELFLQVIPVVQNKLEEKNIDFSIYIDRCIPQVLVADVKRLSELVIRLIDNAVKFSAVGGSVSVATRLENQKKDTCSIMISVTDTGTGISFEQQKQLFETNGQGDHGRGLDSSGGAGQSLALSKQTVKKMGGRIWVDSVINEGTSFHFTFKATAGFPLKANNQGSIKDSIAPPAVPEWAADLSKCTILVVGNSEGVHESFVAALEATMLNIVFVGTAERAISAFLATPRRYQMIFMDVQSSPEASREAARSIRSTPLQLARDIPIVALGPSVSEEESKSYYSAGMNDYLVDPIESEELFTKLKIYLKIRYN